MAELELLPGAPALTSLTGVGQNADDNTDVFGVGVDGTLWHIALIDKTWYGWERDFPRNAPKLKSVTCVGVNDKGNTDVFGVGPDGTLWHIALIEGERWYDWEPDFDQAPKVTSVEVTQGHHTEVFVVGLDGMLLGNHLSAGGWHQWEPNFQGAPKDIASVRATSQGEAVTDLFALRTDGSLSHNILFKPAGLAPYRWSGWSAELQVPASPSPWPSNMFSVMLSQDHDHPSCYAGRPRTIDGALLGVIDGEITASGSYLDPNVQRDRFMGISLHTQNGTFETSVRDRVPTDFFDGKPVNGLWTAVVGGHLPGLPSSVYIHGEYRSGSALISVATHRVTWVTADDTSDYDRCINALGGEDVDGTAWSLSLFEAIAAHEAGQEFYVTNAKGEKVPLVLATSRAGRRYLRTKHDSERPDNLLALPRR